MIAVAPSSDNISVGPAEVFIGLSGVDLEGQPLSTVVRRIEVSSGDPVASFEIQLLRLQSTGSPLGTLSRWYRSGSFARPSAQLSQFGSPVIAHQMGRYFKRGANPLVISFPADDGFECQRDAETTADHSPAISIRRIDAPTSVSVHVNFWFEEF